jgi:hypothetical protein
VVKVSLIIFKKEVFVMRYGLVIALTGILVFGFGISAQAAEWVGVLTGISCAEKGEICPMSESGKEEVVLLAEDKTVLHLQGKEESYLLNHYGHKVKISGEMMEEMGKKTVTVMSMDHLEVVAQ